MEIRMVMCLKIMHCVWNSWLIATLIICQWRQGWQWECVYDTLCQVSRWKGYSQPEKRLATLFPDKEIQNTFASKNMAAAHIVLGNINTRAATHTPLNTRTITPQCRNTITIILPLQWYKTLMMNDCMAKVMWQEKPMDNIDLLHAVLPYQSVLIFIFIFMKIRFQAHKAPLWIR